MVVFLQKLSDTVKLRDGSVSSQLAEVDVGGRVSTNLFATPDSGTTIVQVKCDAAGNISTTNNLVVTSIVSAFNQGYTIAATTTDTVTMLTVPAGKSYVITDYGVTSVDYAGVSMTLVQDTGGGDTDVLRDQQTGTEFMARRSFTEGLVFTAGTVIKLKVTNTQVSISEFDFYMAGREVDV